jgi:hypothetical protein
MVKLGKLQIPSSNLQTSSNFQIQDHAARIYAFWNLDIGISLELECLLAKLFGVALAKDGAVQFPDGTEPSLHHPTMSAGALSHLC